MDLTSASSLVERLPGIHGLTGCGHRNGQQLLHDAEQGGVGDRLAPQLGRRQLADEASQLGGDQDAGGDDHDIACHSFSRRWRIISS